MSNNIHAGQHSARTIEDEIDFRQIIDTLLQHRFIGITVFLCVIAAGLFYLFVATPIFKVDALVQIEQQQLPIPGLEELTSVLGAAGGDNTTQADAEIEVMHSRSVLTPVVQELHLDIDVVPRRLPFFGDTLVRHGLGKFFSHILGHYAWDDERIDVSRLEVTPGLYHDMPYILQAGLDGQYTLDDAKGERILTGKVGQAAYATVANGKIAIYVRDLQASQGTEFTVTSHRVESIVQDLQVQLDIAEKGKQTGVIGLSLTGPDPAQITNILNGVTTSYIQQNVEMHSEQASKSLQFLEQQLPDLRQQLTEAEVALQAYKANKGGGAAVDLSVAGKAILEQVTTIETQLLGLQLQRAELKMRFTDNSPPLKVLQQQIDEVAGEKKNIEDQLKSMPQTELQTIRLMRDVEVANDLYVQLLNKAQEYKVAKAGTVGDARIVDSAIQPWEKSQPKTILILAATVLFAIVAGIGTIFGKVALRRTLETPEPIEAQLGLPVFATIPHSDIENDIRRKVLSGGASALLCREVPHEPSVESLRSLRTSLQFALLEAKNNIVAIHGPTPTIGKSFVASNLAFLLADTDKTVLLIDADMRKGHLHKSLSKPRSPGLSEVITGSSKLDAAIHTFEDGRLKFLSTGKLPPNPAELLTHGNFQALLQQVSKSFDFVIVDTPPTLNLADSISIGRLTGVNFLVVRGGVSTIQDIQIAQRRMDQNGIRIDGIVFNDLSNMASKYGYGGYYSYKYKSDAA